MTYVLITIINYSGSGFPRMSDSDAFPEIRNKLFSNIFPGNSNVSN